MMPTSRMIVTGKVQGVGFRTWAVSHARALGITGWVRHTRAGGIEIMATGDEEALRRLADQCHGGPPLARVEQVELLAAQDAHLRGFTKRLGAS